MITTKTTRETLNSTCREEYSTVPVTPNYVTDSDSRKPTRGCLRVRTAGGEELFRYHVFCPIILVRNTTQPGIIPARYLSALLVGG